MDESLIIGGDLFPTPINSHLFAKGDVTALFGERICTLFQEAKYSVCNLEGVLSDNAGEEIEKASGPKLKASQSSVLAYKNLGVKCLATANNHVMDFLRQGYEDTISLLCDNNIDILGSGVNESSVKKHISIVLSNKRFCIYNVAETMYNIPGKERPGVNVYDEYVVCKELEQLKSQNDYVIVIYHGGTEFFPYPTPLLKKRFHRMADSGADLVTAQHTHCLGCEEHYNGSYLLYGQGNFLFTRHSRHAGGGLLLELKSGSDNRLMVTRHHYKHTTVGVEYDDECDLSDFHKRSSRVHDDVFLTQEFESFVQTLYPHLSNVFQPYTFLDKVFRRLLPSSCYNSYRSHYRTIYPNREQILRIIYTLESEQQHETALYLMYKMLNDLDKC